MAHYGTQGRNSESASGFKTASMLHAPSGNSDTHQFDLKKKRIMKNKKNKTQKKNHGELFRFTPLGLAFCFFR